MEEKDVAAAVAAVAAVMGKIPNPHAQAAAKVVKKAAPFAGVAARVAPAAAKAAAPVAKKAGHAMAGGAVAAKVKVVEGVGVAKGKIAASAGAAKGKIVGAVTVGKNAVQDKARAVAEKRHEKMSRAEGRRALLACAPIAIDAAALKGDAGGASGEQEAVANQFVHFPGCYAAITYGSKFKPKSPDEYREARVFFSPDMGRSLVDDVEGRGDVDVYADAKYDQHVRFYLFPCSEEDARELLPSLVAVLGDGAEAGAGAAADDAGVSHASVDDGGDA